MHTSIASILIEYNGQRGGFDITITHMPSHATENVTQTEHAYSLQGVESVLRNFRIAYNL